MKAMKNHTTSLTQGQTPDYKPSTDAILQIMDIRQAVIDLQIVIETAKEELKTLKSQADELTLSIPATTLNTEIALEHLSSLYWDFEGVVSGSAVSQALKRLGFDKRDILPNEIEVVCPRCGGAFYMEVSTRTEMNRVLGGSEKCADCDAEIEAEREAQTAIYRQQARARQAEIERLRTMPYAEYLQTDHWQDVRRRALKRSGFKCQLCNAGKTALHVHHRTYKNRGQEENSDVIVLCANCHSKFHTEAELSHD